MNWLQLCDNPGAISAYFSALPSLDRFEVTEITLMGYSPSLHLHGALLARPDKYLPRNEGPPPDAMKLILAFWNLSELSIAGVCTGSVGSLTIATHAENHVAFRFESESVVCQGVSKSLMIENLAPRLSAALPSRGLFSYPNVWNSCVLLARANGFSLRLDGDPDEHGSISFCRWIASNEGTKLVADNPIELAGLIALAEHHGPETKDSYWWRIAGPDIITELREQWSASYFGPKSRP